MRRDARALAFLLSGLAFALAFLTLGLVIANLRSIHSLDAADPIAVVMPVTFALVGLLVATRRRHNPIGWLFLFMAVVEGVLGAADQYARLALITHPGSLPGAVWALWVTSVSWGLVYPVGASAMLMMLLPDGRLPSQRWRLIAVLNLLLSGLLVIVLGVLAPLTLTVTDSSSPALTNPTGTAGLQAASTPAFYFSVVGLAFAVGVVAAFAPLIRMRKARGDERQQLKWIAYAIVVTAALSAPLTFLGGFGVVPQWVSTVTLVGGFGVALPCAAGVAIFKHGLYEIDVVISRTLVYGSLAVFITAVYVAIAVGIGAAVGSGGHPNVALSVVATIVVAVGFQPVRERLQRVANRLVYGRRATPYEVLSQFSERVALTYDAESVLPRIAQVLQEATGAESATVWTKSQGSLLPAVTVPADSVTYAPIALTGDSLPQLDGISHAVLVRRDADLLGALSIVKRRGEALTPIEHSLMDDLAGQAGLVLRNVRLTSELMQRIDELRESRQRLVGAQDTERRRLERNLHDGAQQELVALKVNLSLAESLVPKDADKASSMLEQLKHDADSALENLRDLARGIYPPLLADKGLVAALESQARKANLPVRVEAENVTRYHRDIEATVYFCVLEALQNAQKYAGAENVTVRLWQDASLHFAVHDDGRGFDTATVARGAGLTNMQDRIGAVNGSLEVQSTPGHGATVGGDIPLQQAEPSALAAHLVMVTA